MNLLVCCPVRTCYPPFTRPLRDGSLSNTNEKGYIVPNFGRWEKWMEDGCKYSPKSIKSITTGWDHAGGRGALIEEICELIERWFALEKRAEAGSHLRSPPCLTELPPSALRKRFPEIPACCGPWLGT